MSLPRQASDGVFVDVYSEAWGVGDCEVAVGLVEGGLHQAFADFGGGAVELHYGFLHEWLWRA